MIHLNNGLTAEEQAKIARPYAGNCREASFSFEDAGAGIAQFIRDNEGLLIETGKLLDKAQDRE